MRVVDVELPPSAQGSRAGEAAKTGTKETKEAETQAQSACAKKICACARETGLGVLEESMRALTLGKK